MHKEILKGIPENSPEESELKRKLRRIFVVTAAIFLIILFLVYLIPGYHILSIIEGRLVSTKLEGTTINLKDGTRVVFESGAYAALKEVYLKDLKNEFAACLEGRKSGKDYIVTEISIPRTIEKGVFHVKADLCGQDAIIALHSHPYKSCIFSGQDIDYYKAFKSINPDGMIGLMCESDRFTFYSEGR